MNYQCIYNQLLQLSFGWKDSAITLFLQDLKFSMGRKTP